MIASDHLLKMFLPLSARCCPPLAGSLLPLDGVRTPQPRQTRLSRPSPGRGCSSRGQEQVTAALLAKQTSTCLWLAVFHETTGQRVPLVLCRTNIPHRALAQGGRGGFPVTVCSMTSKPRQGLSLHTLGLLPAKPRRLSQSRCCGFETTRRSSSVGSKGSQRAVWPEGVVPHALSPTELLLPYFSSQGAKLLAWSIPSSPSLGRG